MKLDEEKIDSTSKFEGKILHLYVDRVRLPNGHESIREVVRHPGAAAVIALTDENKIPLENQYRYPIGKTLWEIPAGKLDTGEDPLICAKRELNEETGIKAEKWETLGYIYTTPGFSDEKIYLFFAKELTNGRTHLDEDEFVEVKYFTVEEVESMIIDNRITDSKTISAFLRAQKSGLI